MWNRLFFFSWLCTISLTLWSCNPAPPSDLFSINLSVSESDLFEKDRILMKIDWPEGHCPRAWSKSLDALWPGLGAVFAITLEKDFGLDSKPSTLIWTVDGKRRILHPSGLSKVSWTLYPSVMPHWEHWNQGLWKEVLELQGVSQDWIQSLDLMGQWVQEIWSHSSQIDLELYGDSKGLVLKSQWHLDKAMSKRLQSFVKAFDGRPVLSMDQGQGYVLNFWIRDPHLLLNIPGLEISHCNGQVNHPLEWFGLKTLFQRDYGKGDLIFCFSEHPLEDLQKLRRWIQSQGPNQVRHLKEKPYHLYEIEMFKGPTYVLWHDERGVWASLSGEMPKTLIEKQEASGESVLLWIDLLKLWKEIFPRQKVPRRWPHQMRLSWHLEGQIGVLSIGLYAEEKMQPSFLKK